MAEQPDGSARSADVLAASPQQAVQARALEVERLQELRRALLDTEEVNLQLHRQTLEALASLRRELERMKRTLTQLSRARA